MFTVFMQGFYKPSLMCRVDRKVLCIMVSPVVVEVLRMGHCFVDRCPCSAVSLISTFSSYALNEQQAAAFKLVFEELIKRLQSFFLYSSPNSIIRLLINVPDANNSFGVEPSNSSFYLVVRTENSH